jgi:hypothetical protein
MIHIDLLPMSKNAKFLSFHNGVIFKKMDYVVGNNPAFATLKKVQGRVIPARGNEPNGFCTVKICSRGICGQGEVILSLQEHSF